MDVQACGNGALAQIEEKVAELTETTTPRPMARPSQLIEANPIAKRKPITASLV